MEFLSKAQKRTQVLMEEVIKYYLTNFFRLAIRA